MTDNTIVDSSYNEILRKQQHILHEMVKMVMRQTSYTYQEARSELIKHKGNYMFVIKNENGIKDKESDTLSVNQETYRQIRRHMDKGSEQFRKQQELNDYIMGKDNDCNTSK